MTYAFTSERGAEDFVAFLADEYSLDVEILSFLHVEVDESEFSGEGKLEALDQIEEMAVKCGAEDVLL